MTAEKRFLRLNVFERIHTSVTFVIGGVVSAGIISTAACSSPASATASSNTASQSSAPASVAAATTAQATLEKAWSLVTLDGTPVVVPAESARPSLVFDPKAKRASGMAGVNRFSGTYQVEGEALTFGPLLATKMAGPPELNALEANYLRTLERTTGWQAAGGDLELLAEKRVLARFTAKQ